MTPKQRRFVEEYLVDLNASAAARRAGYRGKRVTGHAYRLLRRTPKVAAAIAQAQAERAERTRVSADKVVTELAKVAFGDPRRLLSWDRDGKKPRNMADLSEAEAALVSELVETHSAKGDQTRRLKLHSKLAALDALARHVGLFAGPLAPGAAAAEDYAYDGDSVRARLARRIDRLAAALGTDAPAAGAESERDDGAAS